MNDKVIVSEYLFEKYLLWVKEQREPKTIVEFASAVKINRRTMTTLMEKGTNNIPRAKTIQALSKVIGDDIYDYFGMEKPKEGLDLVKNTWDKLPDDVISQIIELIQPYMDQAPADK